LWWELVEEELVLVSGWQELVQELVLVQEPDLELELVLVLVLLLVQVPE